MREWLEILARGGDGAGSSPPLRLWLPERHADSASGGWWSERMRPGDLAEAARPAEPVKRMLRSLQTAERDGGIVGQSTFGYATIAKRAGRALDDGAIAAILKVFGDGNGSKGA